MASLDKEIFGLEVNNHELVKLAYDAYLANSRSAHAKTLRRGEVRGGGKKPWKQKGTGRARFGSTRNPIWRHGGVAGGRTGEENFTKKVSKQAKRLAVRQALSMKNAEKAVVTIKEFAVNEGKTREAVKILVNNKIDMMSNILLVVPEKDELALRATGNVANLKVVRPTYLNVFDVMNADKIVIAEQALPMISEWLLGAGVEADAKTKVKVGEKAGAEKTSAEKVSAKKAEAGEKAAKTAKAEKTIKTVDVKKTAVKEEK